MLAEVAVAVLIYRHDDHALAQVQGGLQGIGQPAPHPFLDHQAVHHHLDIVTLVALQPDLLVQVQQLSVHASPRSSPCAVPPRAGVQYSPLRPLTTGARMESRVPGSISPILSMICWEVWRSMGLPHEGQCASPMRA